jgi:hypothetical protein
LNIISRLKSLVKLVTFGLAIATTGNLVTSSKANAEITYPLVNGQVVRFYLDNGQGINITTSAGLVNNGWVNSFTGSNTDPEQQFRVVSDGSYYLFVRNGTNFALSSSTLTPTNGSPVVSYTAGNGAWQNLLLDRIDASHYLIKWQSNQNYCVHIPNGANNVQLKLTTCNASDTTQRFNIYTTGGLPNYVSPVQNGFQGVLESQTGQRLTIPGNNVAPGLAYPNTNDPSQQIQFVQSGNGYVLQRVGSNISLSSNTLDYVNNNTQGMALTTYTTGAGRWQNFGFTDAGNGYNNIKWQFNPAYCVSAGTASGSSVGVIVPCSSSDSRQKWRQTGTTTIYQEVTTPYYYAVLSSGLDSPTSPVYSGHTWAGVFKYNKIDKRKYINGVYDSSTYTYELDSGRTTVSAYPTSVIPNAVVPTINVDRPYIDDFINQVPKTSTAYRYRSITAAEYTTAINTYTTQTGCTSYPTNPTNIGVLAGSCNCSQTALSYWKLITGETMKPLNIPIPADVRFAITNGQNGQSMTFVKP